ncbi:MAG: SpoIID/LytB domain-containing protein [Ignavibacteriae bacterium]|nr:SpoIID/LytB domain-containing protein [Ignavibacteriota bacterium]
MNLHENIPRIQVGISSQPTIRFSLVGSFTSPALSQHLSGECEGVASRDGIALRRNGQVIGSANEVVIDPTNPSCEIILNDVTIGVQFHWQRKEDQRFVGGLKLIREGENITAINVVSIEDYLASVISSEMSADCSINLLKAHAITSRSWLLAQLAKSKRLKAGATKFPSLIETEIERIRWYDREDHANFDVCADDHCQRYQGITKAYTASVKQAVESTSGVVLMSDGAICDARFSKSCGGMVEEFQHVWEPVSYPYLKAVVDTADETTPLSTDFSREENAAAWIRSTPDAFCNTRDKKILSQVLLKYDQETTDFFRWKVEYTQTELAEIIRRRSGIDFGEIVDLLPIERGKSSRLTKLKIVGTKRTMIIGKELEIRRTLSNSHLYSSAFVVEKKDGVNGIPSGFTLRGAGWGHGVGLCQIGAAVMGERGYTHEKILAHYFPQTEIKKIY